MLNYNGARKSCTVKHECGTEIQYSSYEYIYKNGPRCDECRRRKTTFKYEIGDVVNGMRIINRCIQIKPTTLNRLKSNKYNQTVKEYQYICERCGFDCSNGGYINGILTEEYWTNEDSISTSKQCACCNAIIVAPEINDVATTHPDVVQFFADKSLANKYSKGSSKQIAIECPNCGLIHTSTRSISHLVRMGPPECVKCGDTISYPEKFMYFLLKQLNISFYFHKTFDWSKNIEHPNHKLSGNKEYDFYIPQYNIIIETHGMHHYEECSLTQKTLDEEQENDLLKKELANRNGMSYIIIDCRKSTKQWVAQNIIDSELNNIVDLNKVNWDKIHNETLTGIKLRIINDKINNPQKLVSELSQEYGVDTSTIRRWLLSNVDNSCYDPVLNFQAAHLKKSKPVFSPELNFAYRSSKFAAEDVGIDRSRISAVINGTGKRPGIHAGKHPTTEEPLTWQYLTVEQYDLWVKNQGNNFIENSYKLNEK